MPHPHIRRRALLIIDMQVGLFHGPEKPHDGTRVLANINQLLAKAHEADASVFAVQHTGPAGSAIEPGSPLTQLLPGLAIDDNRDSIFAKTRPSCFAGTGLEQRLRDASIEELVIVGMKTEFCVDTTCRAAADLGFSPILIADAHTTMDTPVLAAPAIIAHHNKTLSGPFVTLLSTEECAF
jgi:nicotinamidase-related amidase